MSQPTNTRPNPYVGPRPFERGEALFGRDREINDLLHLLMAERIVLFYSPSGAGKTSLIQAGLIPRLEQEEFKVMPVMRVSHQPADSHVNGDGNRYVLSLLLALEQSVPAEERCSEAQLAQLTFGAYLDQREAGRAEESEALIFDQFEEILTIDPTDRAGKEAFFTQVGAVLRKRNRWALFSMREEYRAALDPYLRPLPTRFSNTYRLDLLEERAARLAIQQPAKHSGVTFDDDAAQQLVDELRKPHMQHGDVSLVPALGLYIEPMQLQVVCRRLWERLPDDATTITAQNVTQAGAVDTALADYYADTVKQAAAQTQVAERSIREWFAERLITPQGIRGQVLREPDRSGDLENRVIELLENAHLVRADARRGESWFELAHDRLIAPISQNNAAWFTANLSTLQRQAKLWDENRRQAGFLLSGQALSDVEQWASANTTALDAIEQDFLHECQAAKASAEREQLVKEQEQQLKSERAIFDVERAKNQRIRLLAIGASIVSVIALAAFVIAALFFVQASNARQVADDAQATAQSEASNAVNAKATAVAEATRALNAQATAEAERSRAEQQTRISNSRRLAIESRSNRELQFDLSLLLGIEAVRLDDNVEARSNLLDALTSNPQLSTYLHGNTSAVTSVAFSPDGKTLASGGGDNTIRLWGVAARQLLGQPLQGHTDWLESVAFSPDGKMLASGSADNTIRLWDVATRRLLGQPLTGHTDTVLVVTFSPDGKTLASGSADRTIRLWDVATRRPLGERLAEHTDSVLSVAFSPDGKTLVSGGADTTIRLWDVATHRPLGQPLPGHTESVYSVAFSPEGRTLASGSGDNTIRLWDLSAVLNTGVEVRRPLGQPLSGHTDAVHSVAFTPDGKTLASGSSDKTIRLWDVATGQPLGQPLSGHTDAVYSVAFSPDGKTLASGSGDRTVRLWDIQIALNTGVAALLPIGQPLTGHSSIVYSVAFSPDGKTLASGSSDQAIILWDVATRRPLGPPLTGHGSAVLGVAFSPDGKTLASGSGDHTIRLWGVATRQSLGQPLAGHTDAVTSVAFSPDGKMLASGSADHTIRLWDVATRQPLGQPLAGHSDAVHSVAFSPDGKTLASGSADYAIRLWDVATRRALGQPLSGHTDSVLSVAFSADGRTLASGSGDRTVRLWDVATRQPIGEPLTGHTSIVHSVAFSPDSKTLASGSFDKTIRLWDVDLQSLQARACYIANRNLTRAEWLQNVDPDSSTYRATCPDLPIEGP